MSVMLFSTSGEIHPNLHTTQVYSSICQVCDTSVFFCCSQLGCCFITYYTRKSALEAQNALHNMKILPGVGDHLL